MATTGKHFPGHGSIAPDSHIADAIDERSFDEIMDYDTQTFIKTLDKLDALMPAHVVLVKLMISLQDFLKSGFKILSAINLDLMA